MAKGRGDKYKCLKLVAAVKQTRRFLGRTFVNLYLTKPAGAVASRPKSQLSLQSSSSAFPWQNISSEGLTSVVVMICVGVQQFRCSFFSVVRFFLVIIFT